MFDLLRPRPPRLSTQTALLALVAIALFAGIVPAGVLLERGLARELERQVRQGLAGAPQLLSARDAALGDAAMMHAKDVAHEPELSAALLRGDRAAAARVVQSATGALPYHPVLVDGTGAVVEGPQPPDSLLRATRRGAMPVAVISDGRALYLVSISPVMGDRRWLGAAGVSAPFDEAAAATLATLTRSDLVAFANAAGTVTAAAGDSAVARALARSAAPSSPQGALQELRTAGRRYLVAAAPLGAGRVIFARDLDRALELLPRARWLLGLSGGGALALALLLGLLLATYLARPVRALAAAAAGVSRGDFESALPRSPIRELAQVTTAFAEMRAALAARIEQLHAANRALAERQARLTALQSELIRRERVAVSSRMVAELAHEIRNPIANVRNCLEVIQRRQRRDRQAEEFTSLAIDELLRMHELAERMLDLNRPRQVGAAACDAALLAEETAALARVGRSADEAVVVVQTGGPAPAAIPPDALKQVLLNLIQNAKEAVPHGLRLEIDVRRTAGGVIVTVSDNGPGIPEPLRERIFDPFFTTRASSGGMGLGLSVVEATVQSHGGAVTAGTAPGGGACFFIVLPAAPSDAAADGPTATPETAA